MVKLSTQPGKQAAVSSLSLSTQPVANVTDFKAFAAKLSTQSEIEYDAKKWKRSRERPGWLIRRIKGYSISEDKYGVSYLFVLSRKPDRTSADMLSYPFAGFFNWVALEDAGRLKKERSRSGKQRRA